MNQFDPSRARGEALRQEMDLALWRSVEDILDAAAGADLLAARARPADYAAYSDLVFDHPKGDAIAPDVRGKAAAALRERMDGGGQPRNRTDNLPRIANLAPSCFSPDEIERMNRWWDTEDYNPMGLSHVSSEDLSSARDRLRAAIGLMREADPELFGEMLAIVDEIVLARPNGTQRFNYSAGSSFALWGGILFNVDMHADWPLYYKNLTHEAGHNLLFAIGREGGFVGNSINETYSSPVRDDPRPIDGIFHAAFVMARESRAFHRLLEWNETARRLSNEEIATVEAILEESVISFWQCCEALEESASLTALGEAVLRDCRDYMAAHFELLTD